MLQYLGRALNLDYQTIFMIIQSIILSIPTLVLFIMSNFNEYNSAKTISQTEDSEARNCKNHYLPLQFICTEKCCSKGPMLCCQCLPLHRNHKWDTMNNMKKQINSIGTDKKVKLRNINVVLKQFRKRIDRKMIELEQKINKQIIETKNNIDLIANGVKQISIQNVDLALKMHRNYKNNKQDSILVMQKLLTDSFSISEDKILTILSDLHLIANTNWLRGTQKQGYHSLRRLKLEINQQKKSEEQHSQNFMFANNMKHAGITLSEDYFEANYTNSSIKGPAAILNHSITHQNKISFQIVKLSTTAFFFPDTTILIGICIPSIVKSHGFRKLSQVGKGAFMIGSTGWCYHHKNLAFDRKNKVGWKFGEKDIIKIEVSLEKRGEIKFIKQGFFYDYQFSMPLDLQIEQLNVLRPCISFQSQIGAIVRVLQTQGQ